MTSTESGSIGTHGEPTEPFPYRSKLISIRGGGSAITEADIIDLNQHLLPSLPYELRMIAANLLNFGWHSLLPGTRWFFKKDDHGHIIGAVMNDLRDHYTRLFCDPALCCDLLEEVIDWNAEAIYFGCTPEAQLTHIEAAMERHRFHSKIGFELYPMIFLSNYEKFEESRKAQKTLSPGFVSDSLKWPTDSDYVNATWTYSSATSHITIGESVYSRPSACIRDPERVGLESSPDFTLTNDLVGWEIVRSDYSLGSLKVLEPYRMRGFGKWLSTELTAKLISVPLARPLSGIAVYPHPQPIAFVDQENQASFKLHQGLGFETGTKFGWTSFNRHDNHQVYTVS
jgi:ribosomal protein S18 acetylase RimI-like enzyme